MTSISVSSVQLLAGVGVLVVAGFVWRAGARRARAVAHAARAGGRLLSLAGRVVFTASLLVGAQWTVIMHPDNPWLLLAVLALPDLFAAFALVRALTVTTVEAPHRRGRR